MTITDDDLFEGTETFSYTLFGVSRAFSDLTFLPAVTTVNVIDNDGGLELQSRPSYVFLGGWGQ